MSKGLLLFGALIVGTSTFLSGQSFRESCYFEFKAANDVLYLPAKTDRYFTSGLNLEYGRRERKTSPSHPSQTKTTERYWRLTQNIYTPQEIDAKRFLEDDRPYASYLTLTRGKFSDTNQQGLSFRWELTAGVLGRYSGGGRMQNAWHSLFSYADEVPGWPNEVKPDVILNYQLGINQRLPISPRLSFTAGLTGRVGTLYNNLSSELKFSWLAIRLGEKRTLSFDLLGRGRLVAYDATLSGGLLNRDERYRGRIQPKPLVGTFGLDATIHFDGLKLSGGLRHLSTEFEGGTSHAWAWFSVGVELNK